MEKQSGILKDEFEVRHIQYVQSSEDPEGDACIVKEIIHHPDGTSEPNLRVIRNYQRPWYITKEGFRGHPYKKGSEFLNKLQRFETNDRMMPAKIAKVLNKNRKNLNMRLLARSQYLYGTDITSPVLLKKSYQDHYNGPETISTLAVLDIETNVRSAPLPEDQEIIYIGLTMKNKAFLCYTKEFLKGIANPDQKLQEAFDTYLGDKKRSRGITLETLQVNDPGEAVYETIKRAHAWAPDFLVIYNVDFDLSVMLKMCNKYGYDENYVFSDPNIPPDLKHIIYNRGAAKRVSSSGKVLSFNPWERWHSLIAPASFYLVCAMSTYAFIRKAEGNELSYKLDDVLEKNIGQRKLNFSFADHITDRTEWHFFMQANYKIEYGIYCLYDCIGVEELDEKTMDISTTLPGLIGISEYQNFNSTPKQLADDMHFHYLYNENSVIDSTSDQMRDEELDNMVPTMAGWIITLPTHLVADNGMRIVKNMSEQPTLYRGHVSDLDVRSAYPWGEITMNVGKETTAYEICRIENVTINEQRIVGLNITGGATNAVEYCNIIHKLPTLEVMSELVAKELLKQVA